MNGRATLIGLLLVMAALALPASASAEWGAGNTCSWEKHCYAIGEWKMSKAGEEVKGLSSVIDTTSMNVPYPKSREFVDNEEWAGFPQQHENPIPEIEMGQEAGLENCCSLHPFWAYETKTGIYGEAVMPWTVEGYTWNSYTLEDPKNNGRWCARYGESDTFGCETGFSAYAKLVEVGAEVADEAEPENSGQDQTGVQHLNGLYAHWNEAWWRSNNAKECIGGYEDIAGYVKWSSC